LIYTIKILTIIIKIFYLIHLKSEMGDKWASIRLDFEK